MRRVYAQEAGIPFDQAPDPREINQIASEKAPGNSSAAKEAYRQLGVVVGDAMGNVLTLVDGLAVIGGGVSNAWRLFLPTLVDELNSTYTGPTYVLEGSLQIGSDGNSGAAGTGEILNDAQFILRRGTTEIGRAHV